MKYKIEFYLIALFLALSLNSSVMAGRTLDGTKVVSDADAELLEGEDIISTSKFVKQAQALNPDELAEMDTLNLQGAMLYTVGLRKVFDELLPLLPNLKFFNLYNSDLRTQEDLELIASILEKYDNLEYVDIVGNGIANHVLSFVKAHEEQKGLTDKFQRKVVFSFKTLLEDQFPGVEREHYKEWYQTHIDYYILMY